VEIIIKELANTYKNDFLDFFENRGFMDNPEWDSCYCVFFHHDRDIADWCARTKEENRNDAIKFIENNKMKGFLAYYKEEAVGWCNVNKKSVFSFHKTRENVYDENDKDIVSIVCFLIYHIYRRKGISTKLLNSIIDHYKGTDYSYIEAYPEKKQGKEKDHYYGHLSMYLKNRFTVYKEFDNYYIVRYKL